ncbi:hypothetical protein [Siccirubricoccus phaeus]|uniref:hypothetical protein n=1 Tax=Siccirubricoccus phaeus TaxID=2595053 RepID=UPI0011F0EE34|nr:hypothetical protein [Siccirubricoccus phaeus]
MPTLSGHDLSAASVWTYITQKREAAAAAQRSHAAALKAEREKLHAAFLERELAPDWKERVAAMVQRAVDAGEKEVLLFHFPSDWLPDQGRAITNGDSDWHEKLEGFARRAYDAYAKELAPKGFHLKAQIIDWPGGMPGDVGFILRWPTPEEA